MTMHSRLLLASVASCVLMFSQARADEILVHEIDSLRNELPLTDPSRPALTLRLADAMFDEVIALGRLTDADPAIQKKIDRYQRNALALYSESLSQKNLSTINRLKIRFQIARIYASLGDLEKATPIWKEMAAQDELLDLKREAALRLAEVFEAQNTPGSADLAHQNYDLALKLCGGTDLCSYIHYKIAWLLKNEHKTDAALKEMELALYDSRGQVREESLRDLVSFTATSGGDGHDILVKMEQLSEKINRPQLLMDLANAFFSAGNKVAGTTVLATVNSRTTTLKTEVRLMEEYYGLRNWDLFRKTLDQAQSQPPVLDLQTLDNAESEKILRRLTIQLDGERNTQKANVEDFKSTVLLYMKLFPQSAERPKMVDGWLAAETHSDVKIDALKKWIDTDNGGFKPADILKLHERRGALAQAAKRNDIVVEEMSALAALSSDAATKRKYTYHKARALYEMKDLDKALPLFQELATLAPGVSPDQWAVQSVNLTLDILNQQKRFGELVAQSDAWSKQAGNDEKAAKDVKDIRGIRDQAEFEQAVSLGSSPEALVIFKRNCIAKKFVPKSCENAKVISIQLKDQKSLFEVLSAQGLKDELASEYESAGYFTEAAKLLEARLTPKTPDVKLYLKVALLYELGRKNADRDRVLEATLNLPLLKKPMGPEEVLLFESARDAKILKPAHLGLAWKATVRAHIADVLESNGKGTDATRKILMSQSESVGPAWTKLILAETIKLDSAQRQLDFHGKNGQKRFNNRLAALKKLVAFSEAHLQGADSVTRVKIALVLAHAHKDLANEILNSPLPAGLDEASIADIKATMTKMAVPFNEKAQAYDDLSRTQLAKVEDVTVRTHLETMMSQQGPLSLTADAAPSPLSADVDEPTLNRLHQALHENPVDGGALSEMKTAYEASGQQRLAAYFSGRLLQLKKEGAQQK